MLRPLPGIKLLGAPIGTDAYVAKFLRARMARIDVLLSAVAELNDPNISMHMDRPGDIYVTTEAGCSERGYTSAAFDFTVHGAIPDNRRSSALLIRSFSFPGAAALDAERRKLSDFAAREQEVALILLTDKGIA